MISIFKAFKYGFV